MDNLRAFLLAIGTLKPEAHKGKYFLQVVFRYSIPDYDYDYDYDYCVRVYLFFPCA